MICMWCKGDFADIEGPVHPYMESTPGCWAAYTKLLEVEYRNYAVVKGAHRMTADTYAAQHPGQRSRVSTQSVSGHLFGLECYLVRGMDGDTTRKYMKRVIDRARELTWLEPPDFSGTLNVNHPLSATDMQDHIVKVKEWGWSVLNAWRALHGSRIQDLVERILHHSRVASN
jgi:hypothetical protein